MELRDPASDLPRPGVRPAAGRLLADAHLRRASPERGGGAESPRGRGRGPCCGRPGLSSPGWRRPHSSSRRWAAPRSLSWPLPDVANPAGPKRSGLPGGACRGRAPPAARAGRLVRALADGRPQASLAGPLARQMAPPLPRFARHRGRAAGHTCPRAAEPARPPPSGVARRLRGSRSFRPSGSCTFRPCSTGSGTGRPRSPPSTGCSSRSASRSSAVRSRPSGRGATTPSWWACTSSASWRAPPRSGGASPPPEPPLLPPTPPGAAPPTDPGRARPVPFPADPSLPRGRTHHTPIAAGPPP